MRVVLVILAVAFAVLPAAGGHSRFPYLDGGRSPDGRYVVAAELVPGVGKAPPQWRFKWTDTTSGASHTGKLDGLRSGTNAVFDPVHAHVFVPPGGETFAVWNPNVMAPTDPPNAKWPDLATPEARKWAGFTHRLTVYRKTGDVVRRLDLADFLTDADWAWLFCYGRQVYWQANYPGLTRDNAPRVGYALYRISADHTVLETLVGPTEEAARVAKGKGVTPPAPRAVRVDLVTGRVLDALPSDLAKRPGRPFVGPLTNRGEAGQAGYVPSPDPLRAAGTFRTPAKD